MNAPGARSIFLEMEAAGANPDELWLRTGYARCDDCGHLMRTATLVSLPDHRCSQRQARRRNEGRESYQ
jgi:hypothetical protein